ncbi:hypothetical protein MTsN4n12_33340 [Microbacterium sp. MTN4-12]
MSESGRLGIERFEQAYVGAVWARYVSLRTSTTISRAWQCSLVQYSSSRPLSAASSPYDRLAERAPQNGQTR